MYIYTNLIFLNIYNNQQYDIWLAKNYINSNRKSTQYQNNDRADQLLHEEEKYIATCITIYKNIQED